MKIEKLKFWKKNKNQKLINVRDNDNPAKTKRLLKDRYEHLIFKIKMLDSWVKESKKPTKENEQRKLQLHNMKYEYKRICKELGIKE